MFKNKGMQLGSKGAKKQADLLETLGGAPVPEDRAPLMLVSQFSGLHLTVSDQFITSPSQSQEQDVTPASALAAATGVSSPAAPQKPENPFGPVDEEE